MSAGSQVVNGTRTVANNSTITIQPTAGIEWLITTLGGTGAFRVQFAVDGTNFDDVEDFAAGSVHGLHWRLTNAVAMKLKNISGGTATLFYAGVQTL